MLLEGEAHVVVIDWCPLRPFFCYEERRREREHGS
jgi:hypothetical protein